MNVKVKNLIPIFYTIILSFFVHAAEIDQPNPESFPPTAFQLAQIVDFISKPSSATEDITKVRGGFDSYYFEKSDPYGNGSGKYYHHIHDAVRLYKSTKARFEQDENPWKSFVSFMMGKIALCNTSAYFECIKDSFDLAGTLELITNAIIHEEDYMKKGKTIFWRCSDKSANTEIEFTSEENIQNELETYRDLSELAFKIYSLSIRSKRDRNHRYSFSIGLFSGFFFDGVWNARLERNCSACTFIYWSSDQYIQKTRSAGLQPIINQIIDSFPEYIKSAPNTKDSLLKATPRSLFDYLCAIETFYTTEKQPFQLFKFREDRRILDSSTEPKNDHLFGLILDAEENDRWVKGIHAVFGSGEYFHPKIPYPDEPEIVEIWPMKETSSI